MPRLIRSALPLLAIIALLASAEAPGRSVRKPGEGIVWNPAPVSILQQLPPGVGFPPGLFINPLGTSNPVDLDDFTGATAPDIVREGFTLDANGVAQPAVLAVESNPAIAPPLLAFDAQQPAWFTPAYVCPATGLASAFYACSSNPIVGLKVEWGGVPSAAPPAPALEQIVFLNLGSPAGVQLYDAADYNCQPNGVNFATGAPCQYDNVGAASNAWAIEFNCGPGGCANGATLELHGTRYTASPGVLTNANPADPAPDGGPPLNEFVYTGGKLYAPPGWQSFTVTGTALLGPRCQFTAGNNLNFYAAVVAWGLQGIPSGTVQLLDGGVPIANANLNALGLAKFTVALSAGGHSLTMAYQGNATYAPSQSPVDALMSKPNPPPAGCTD